MDVESVKDLSHFERKLITIIQHQTRRGDAPSLEELERRLGHGAREIKDTTKDLIKRRWLGISKGKLVVRGKVF